MAHSYDVLVVGAGPSGLMAACWLARAGVKALVIDDKLGPVNESRAVGVQARTMETYDMMGLGERARAEGTPARGAAMWLRHRKVASAVLAEMGHGISPHPYLFVMGQDRTERMLLDDLRAHGGDVAYDTRLETLAQGDSHVEATIRRPDGRQEALTAAYVLGADGARSPVRHAVGLAFEGGTYPQRFFVADVVAEGPLAHGELGLCPSEDGFLAFFPMLGDNHYRIIGVIPKELADRPGLCFDDVREAVRRHSAMAVHEALWFATYNVHHRVANHFREGRVFLLGDAGHIHSPVGGQGMNTGLMDAVNLAWKLAAVVKGACDARVLDSYEIERRPFALQLVETTDRIFTFVSSPSPWVGHLRATLAPWLLSLATHLPVLRRELFGLISQTRISYHASPLSEGSCGTLRAGDRLPWMPWPTGGSNYDALRLLRPHIQVYGDVPQAIEDFARAHPGLPLVRQPLVADWGRSGLTPGTFYFVRPDGYIAYTGDAFFDAPDFLSYLETAWGARPEQLERADFGPLALTPRQ